MLTEKPKCERSGDADSETVKNEAAIHNVNPGSSSHNQGWFWVLILVYAAARVLQVYPGPVSMLGIVVLHVLPTALFALVHGARRYGMRGILVFFAICLIVGGTMENVGVLTGVPYGRYYFTDVMGPKFLFVPFLLALAYVGMGYLSWTLANLIAGESLTRLPLTATFIMVSWDLAMEPVWATVVHAWTWLDGGPYFGVPLSNFIGWFLTVYLIYQLFALFLRRHPPAKVSLPREYWRQAIKFYLVSAAGNLPLLLPHPGPAVVFDPTGIQWTVSSITAATALVTVFTMGAFVWIAWLRSNENMRFQR